mgnify:FL=1
MSNIKSGPAKPGPGRPKGAPNKVPAMLKDALMEAAHRAGGKDGLVGYLARQAVENPQSFLPLLGKVLPLQVSGDPNAPIAVHVVQRVIVDPARSSD